MKPFKNLRAPLCYFYSFYSCLPSDGVNAHHDPLHLAVQITPGQSQSSRPGNDYYTLTSICQISSWLFFGLPSSIMINFICRTCWESPTGRTLWAWMETVRMMTSLSPLLPVHHSHPPRWARQLTELKHYYLLFLTLWVLMICFSDNTYKWRGESSRCVRPQGALHLCHPPGYWVRGRGQPRVRGACHQYRGEQCV